MSIVHIAARGIYLPDHQLSTGDEVTYSPNVDPLYEGDGGIGISTVGIITAGVTYTTPTSPLADGTKLFLSLIHI